ncbi:AAA family ATPase [Falsihalocynthiibacter arcticus]|uniref:AAA+ ATPase domain-containing protein n=1 Tax=Falsihalocynthiibacter arcticus TaxID=1579316 RepID=A0A126UYF3_9RHOB|nr:AAA family ATPase [Falsihalocynthiibacter arcticus]AML51074.1 hypothetical protein RC74_07120 [Falsihalocynthiibacter arcticus]
MKTTKLIHATYPEIDGIALIQRFADHLVKLRTDKLAAVSVGDDEQSRDLGSDDIGGMPLEQSSGVELTWQDTRRIEQRVNKIIQRMRAASGLAHLKDEEIIRLRPLFTSVKLLTLEGEHWVDELIATLHAEMPWMAPATIEVWHALQRGAATGGVIRIPPLILNGPPGIGKSVWARRLSELLHIPRCEIDASLGGVGFSIAGTERGWSSAQAGRPLETILQHQVGNPLMVVDEICKAQSGTSTNGANHSFANSLLSLLEPATSAAWECPYYRTKIDMSHISWVLTANDASRIPAPLLSRCVVINLPKISCAQLQRFAVRKADELGLTKASADAIEQVIGNEMQKANANTSLRDVVRILRRAEVLESRPMLH